jgi:uncharacterized protein YabN with tetrapyrrole methylase and pyrophosphatase domain
MPTATLTIAGTGLRPHGQLTPEARHAIENADCVFYAVADQLSEDLIRGINPKAKSFGFYIADKPRIETYKAWVENIMTALRAGEDVCAIFYGHPGLLTYSSHVAAEAARAEGMAVRWLPGISCLDCMFSDLGIEPAWVGLQCFEATEFLIHRRKWDCANSLILFQIACIGQRVYVHDVARRGLKVLTEVLEEAYGPDQEVVVYEAAIHWLLQPVIDRMPLRDLADARISHVSTLYIPPARDIEFDPDMAARIGWSA